MRSFKNTTRRTAMAVIAGASFVLSAGPSLALEKIVGVTAQGGPTAQLFPFFIAMEKGYYKDEGLDVDIKFSKGSSDGARQLAAGNVEFAIVSAAALMQTQYAGFPLKVIMQVYYPDTFDIVVPEKSDIKSIADLKGKTLGLSDLAGGEVTMTRASLSVAGVKEGSEVKMVVAGEGDPTTIRSFEEGRIQAYAGAKRDILLIPAQGIPLRVITPPEVATFPGDGLAVRAETLKEKPETLAKLVRATLKGWAWAKAHPDEAFMLMKTKWAAATLGDNPVAEPFWKLVLAYYTAPSEVEKHGTILPARWKNYMDFMQLGEEEQKPLKGPVELDALLTNDVVDKAYVGLDLKSVN
ncbi:ABC transporter substrate-binding protein [Flaviflagellibacter deserti]|uniref:ABC transporter substrate-binding protein n=1 Tax=Flaviflagellibacter deserti TaxID=2267266 RepID=A0ABV9YZ42_9HYPH